ncbi:hypothetical protein O7627_22320 [Solwaraspora sp. WMMD1047]|uniref:hypothetical protein n=1 Tax=Solwaraspora sp. WMMD1047 TaxID=3016102 RepID=UPI002415E87F|nr:hypothetical protein [Solwaraspora sp. WMMD1047]MDG4832021.1 hypothetical protein [Solwaraspora sp. WMMD1047]
MSIATVSGKRAQRLLAVVAVGALVAVGLAAPASAGEGPARVSVFESAMNVVGYDRAVAKANGYEIRTDENGREYSVPKGSAPDYRPAEAVVQDERVGNCGRSFVYLYGLGNHQAEIHTGWRLNSGMSGAVQQTWSVSVLDDYGVSIKRFDRLHASEHSWQAWHTFTAGGPTWVTAEVIVGTVVLWNGTICFALGPIAHKYV